MPNTQIYVPTKISTKLQNEQQTIQPTVIIDDKSEEINNGLIASDSTTFSIFVSSRLGITFSYPSEWGELNEKIEDAKKAGYGDSGKVYILEFPQVKNRIFGAGTSSDFSAGRGGMRGDFSGYPQETPNVKSYIDIVDPGCFTMGAQNSFMGNIDFNLPSKEINGVRLFIPVLTEEDRQIILKKYNISDISEEECWNNKELEEKYTGIGLKMQEDIKNNIGLSEVSKQNLKIFHRIAESSKIIN